ncbi:MAG TPA: hypothetical protein G4O00_14460, partial [Thermoflexia bacterium]|nr:hypothetical protein [Thermoflexia bacterium]
MVPLVPSSVQPIECRRNANPFIFSPQLVHQLQLLTFARKALALAYRLARPRPLPSARGRPPTYADETILVTVIVMAIWQLSPYQMA